MKAIPSFLVAGALLVGAACSTANSGSGNTSDGGASPTAGAASSSPATSSMPAGYPTSTTNMADNGDTGAPSVAAADVPAADMVVFVSTFSTMSDPVFLINLASSNRLEMQAGQQAMQQGASPDVKQYAQLMLAYLDQTDKDLQNMATQLNVTLPTAMLPVHQVLADRMLNKAGKEFDEAYMDLMERARKLDIAMFEAKSRNAETPAVKSFVARTLPVLRSHKTLADKIEKRVD